MEHDGFSDKSEREAHDDWDTTANENGGRLTEESDMDQSDELSPGPQATAYVEQSNEEMAEVRCWDYSHGIYEGALFELQFPQIHFFISILCSKCRNKQISYAEILKTYLFCPSIN